MRALILLAAVPSLLGACSLVRRGDSPAAAAPCFALPGGWAPGMRPMTVLLAPARGTEGVEAGELLLRPRADYTRAYWRRLSADSVLLRWVTVDDRTAAVMEYAAAEIRGRLTNDTLRGEGRYGSDVSARPERPSGIAAPRTTCPAELLAPAA